MSKLLIVESPGKIKKISEYLGNDYIVSASVGHIIDLDEKNMSIDLETFSSTKT
jgi:DNA topoisomerase-1